MPKKHHAQQFEIPIPNEPFALIQDTTPDPDRLAREEEQRRADQAESEKQTLTLDL